MKIPHPGGFVGISGTAFKPALPFILALLHAVLEQEFPHLRNVTVASEHDHLAEGGYVTSDDQVRICTSNEKSA